MKELISVITPNYNAAQYLTETINSVINQTYKNWEMIIIDDCSTDASIEIIQKFIKQDKRIKLLKLKINKGPAVTRNVGIENAKGKYLTFLDADDLWLPYFLEKSLHNIKDSPGFVFSSYHRYNESLKPIYSDFIVPAKVTYYDILKTNSISCLTAFIDIEKLGKLMMPKILYRQDMGLWLQYLKLIDYAKGDKECLAIYRIRQKSHSRNKFNLIKHQWFFYRNIENLSILKSIYYFVLWVIFGLKKYYK